MSALLLDPHGDDAVLFAAYTCQRESAPMHVLVTHQTVPGAEIAYGLAAIGCLLFFPPYIGKPTRVYAPASHPEGHEEHNEAAEMALAYGVSVVSYCTYAPRGHRSVWGTEVVPSAKEIALKLRALSCYESQIEQASTRPWFFELLDLREWVAE